MLTEIELASGRPRSSVPAKEIVAAAFTVKVAVTILLVLMITEQAPEPEQAPPQLEKAYPELGAAVTATTSPWLYVCGPAAGLTVPPPVGVTAVVSTYVGTAVKVAVTALLALIVTEQVLDPVQAPLQVEKAYPELAVAVTATTSPWL